MLLGRAKWLWISVILGLSLGGTTAAAQSKYPPAEDPYVNDYAEMLNQRDVEQLRAWLADLKQQTNIRATVVTIKSIKDYDTGDETVKSFAVNLFNAWDIDDKATHKGVLVLWAVKEGQFRIQLGAGHGDPLNAVMEQEIDKRIAPDSKKDEAKPGTVLLPEERKPAPPQNVDRRNQRLLASPHAKSVAVPPDSTSSQRVSERCALLKDYMEGLTHIYYSSNNLKADRRLAALKSRYTPSIRKMLPKEFTVELADYEKLCQCVHKMKLAGVPMSQVYARGTCGATTTKEKRLEIMAKCKSCPAPALPE